MSLLLPTCLHDSRHFIHGKCGVCAEVKPLRDLLNAVMADPMLLDDAKRIHGAGMMTGTTCEGCLKSAVEQSQRKAAS